MSKQTKQLQGLLGQINIIQTRFDGQSDNVVKFELELDKLRQSLNEYKSKKLQLLNLKIALSQCKASRLNETDFDLYQTKIDELKDVTFKSIMSQSFIKQEVDQIVMKRLQEEREKLKKLIQKDLNEDYTQKKNETQKEFCTLLALILILFFVIVIVLAFKAEEVFCSSSFDLEYSMQSNKEL